MGRAITSLAALTMFTSPVFAQGEGAEPPSYALAWTIAALFTVGIMLIVCVPSRKGRENDSME